MTFLDSKQIKLKALPSTENYTLQDLQNLNNSTGVISGGEFSNNGDGTIKVNAGTGQIRNTNTIPGTLYFLSWPEIPSVTLNNYANNWIYFKWNSGTPTLEVSLVQPVDRNTNVILGNVYREDTTLHLNLSSAVIIGDHAAKIDRFNKDTQPYAHVSGAILTDKGQRKLSISAGVFWQGLTRFTTSAYDTSTTGSFRYWYHDNLGNWTSTYNNTQIDNTQFDSLTGRVPLTAGYYTNAWIFLSTNPSDPFKVVYDINEYETENLADGAFLPPLPPAVEAYCFIIGRAIIKQGQSEFVSLKNIFQLGVASVNSLVHNNLNGLQGGAGGEYYHLSADQYNNLANAIDGAENGNTAGFGTFLDQVGVTLRFKGINIGSNKLSIQDNGTTKSIDLDVNEANLALNNIGGILNSTKGGTGLNTSSSTGIPKITSGTWSVNATTSDLAEGSNLYFTDERVDDRVAALIQNGTGITWTYNDVANTLTGNVSITQYTDEMAQDAVGNILTDSSTIDFTYNDAGNAITASVIQSGLTLNNLSGTLGISKGGTNLTTTPTNGQLLIGNGTGYSLSTLTAGTDINITNNAGSITIASTAGKGFQPGDKIAFSISANESKSHASTNSTSFVVINTVAFDKNMYSITGGTRSFKITIILDVTNNNTAAEVRLYNVTTNSVVNNSTISVTPGVANTDFVYTVNLNDADIASGLNIYEFQARKASGSGRTSVYWQNLQVVFSF